MKKTVTILVTGLMLTGVAACSGNSTRHELIREAAFWQRANSSQAALMDGAKAQQMLERDIARCTTELYELEYLGTIDEAMTPEKTRYRDPADDNRKISRWNVPDKDDFIRDQDGYYTFQTCMRSKGWQRVEHHPYDKSFEARQDYLDTVIGQRYQSTIGDRRGTADGSALDYN